MPLYDVMCPDCGSGEVVRAISLAAEPLACPSCGGEATQTFSPDHAPSARIDDMASVGHDRHDNTKDINLGLPGKFVEVNGRTEYRPTTNSEANSNRAARRIAHDNGLTVKDGGRYKPTPK